MQLQIEEISRRLRSGDLGIPANPEERFGVESKLPLDVVAVVVQLPLLPHYIHNKNNQPRTNALSKGS